MDTYAARAELRYGNHISFNSGQDIRQGVVVGVGSYTVEVREKQGGLIERVTFNNIVEVLQPSEGILESGLLLWVPRPKPQPNLLR